jgi:excisionase family DNA binding protein
MIENRELLTVPEAAAMARVSRQTMYRLIAKKVVPALRVGPPRSRASVRIPADAFRSWLYGAPEDRAGFSPFTDPVLHGDGGDPDAA